jgi:hypothetical protein
MGVKSVKNVCVMITEKRVCDLCAQQRPVSREVYEKEFDDFMISFPFWKYSVENMNSVCRNFVGLGCVVN